MDYSTKARSSRSAAAFKGQATRASNKLAALGETRTTRELFDAAHAAEQAFYKRDRAITSGSPQFIVLMNAWREAKRRHYFASQRDSALKLAGIITATTPAD